MRRHLAISSSLCALAFVAIIVSPADGAGILNGSFTDPGTPPETFDGWRTETTLGDPPADGGDFALFEVVGVDPQTLLADARQLEQAFLLPANATSLSFLFQLATTPGGVAGGQFLDTFQATLYDPLTFDPLLPFSLPDFPGFYTLENDGTDYRNAAGVSLGVDPATGWTKVTLDVRSIAGRDVLLEFLLTGDDDERATSVSVDSVELTLASQVIPEPAAAAIWGVFGMGLLAVACRGRRRRAC